MYEYGLGTQRNVTLALELYSKSQALSATATRNTSAQALPRSQFHSLTRTRTAFFRSLRPLPPPASFLAPLSALSSPCRPPPSPCGGRLMIFLSLYVHALMT